MKWPIIFSLLLASTAVLAEEDDDEVRPKRDLQYLKNLIASSIFGIPQNRSDVAPILVQEDGNVKIYRIPGDDNILLRSVPKNPYRIEQMIPVEPIVEQPAQVLETYLGTKTIDETVAALQGIRNLLASGILIKPGTLVPMKPTKLPLIPVIPPPKPVPVIEEVLPIRPLEYPEIIAFDIPNQYSYKQVKPDGSVTRWSSKGGGDVIVTDSRQPMPLPPPYILERLRQVYVQPIPVHPFVQTLPFAAPRPIPQYNIPFVPLPPEMPVITRPSNVNVKPFSIREEIDVGPSKKETDFVVPEPVLYPPMPPALFLNNSLFKVSGIESPLFKQHNAFLGPVPLGPYAPSYFEPYRPSNNKGEPKVEGIHKKKGHQFLRSLYHPIPVRNSHQAAILERPARFPVRHGPIVKKLENVVALAVHPPKVSAGGYSFKIGTDIKNLSVSTAGSTVKDIKYETPNTSPASVYSYKKVSGDGVTTFTGSDVTNTVNIVNRLNTVPVIPSQVEAREMIKQEEPKAVLFTSPVSSTFVYKQINQNAAQPVTVAKVDNTPTETKQSYNHYHFLTDGSKQPCSEVHVNPTQEEKKSYVYTQVNQNGARQVHVVRANNIPNETKQSYTHYHVFSDGSKRPCSEVHVNSIKEENKTKEPRKPDNFVFIPPLINETPVSGIVSSQSLKPASIPPGVKMLTVPILKIDSEKLNITTNYSYKQLTDTGMLTINNGDGVIKEYVSHTPDAKEATQTVTAVVGSLTDNPIIVLNENEYTTKEKRDSSTSRSYNEQATTLAMNSKDKSENIVSDEVSDSKHGRQKHMRGDIPEA